MIGDKFIEKKLQKLFESNEKIQNIINNQNELIFLMMETLKKNKSQELEKNTEKVKSKRGRKKKSESYRRIILKLMK